MAEESTAQLAADTATVSPLEDINPDARGIIAARSQADSLLATIKEQADIVAAKSNDIEQARTHAEKIRAEIDAQLSAMREAVDALKQQAESAKTTIAEITTLFGATQSSNQQILEGKAQGEASLESLRNFVKAATEVAGQLEGFSAKAVATQAVIAEKSDHIEKAQEHADGVRSKMDRALTEAQQSAINAEAQHQSSQTALANLNKLYESAQTVKANTISDADIVANLRQKCEEHTVTAKKLADVADVTDEKVKAYETRLAEFDKASGDTLTKIKELLPGATSAGLAAAFCDQKGRFKRPQQIWFYAFVGSLIVFFLLGVAAFVEFFVGGHNNSWDVILRYLVQRLPIVIPLVWMAIYAGRHYMLALKMEEDYAFKEAVSRAFEGYKREMTGIPATDATTDTPLTTLCNSVLKVIGENPGRLYESPTQDITPMNEVGEAIKPS